MSCLVCLKDSNLEDLKLIEKQILISDLVKTHFDWIQLKYEEDVLCKNCLNILLDFTEFIEQIKTIHVGNKAEIEFDIISIKNEDLENDFHDFNQNNKNNNIVSDTNVLCKLEHNEFSNIIATDNEINVFDSAIVKEKETTNKDDDNKLMKNKSKKIKSNVSTKVDTNKNEGKQKTVVLDEKLSEKSNQLDDADKIIASFLHKLKCAFCQIEFDKFSSLKKHFREDHGVTNAYTMCCAKRFHRRIYLLEHIQAHLDPDILKCPTCEKKFTNLTCLKKHIKINHNGERKAITFKCKLCEETFLSKSLYARHEATHIPEVEWTVECDKEGCSRKFATKTLLSIHRKNVHYKKMKICQHCGAFVATKRFKAHILNHSDNPGTIECKICNAKFKSKQYLKVHMSKHQDAGKIYQCPTCGKISPHSKALQKHIGYAHGTVKLHKCIICDKQFKRPYVLKQHMAAHSGQPLYNCPYCDRTFFYDSHFHAHKKASHPMEYEKDKAKTKLNRTNFNELNHCIVQEKIE